MKYWDSLRFKGSEAEGEILEKTGGEGAGQEWGNAGAWGERQMECEKENDGQGGQLAGEWCQRWPGGRSREGGGRPDRSCMN